MQFTFGGISYTSNLPLDGGDTLKEHILSIDGFENADLLIPRDETMLMTSRIQDLGICPYDESIDLIVGEPGTIDGFAEQISEDESKVEELAANNSCNYKFAQALMRFPKHVHLLSVMNEHMREDTNLANIAVFNDVNAYCYFTGEASENEELAKYVLSRNPELFEFAGLNIRSDHDTVKRMVSICGTLLRFASDDLRNDVNIFKTALKNNSMAYRYGSEELRNDEELMAAMCDRNVRLFEYASSEIRSNRRFIDTLVRKGHIVLPWASDEVLNDREFMLEMCSIRGDLIYTASAELLNDDGFMKMVEEIYPCVSMYQINNAS